MRIGKRRISKKLLFIVVAVVVVFGVTGGVFAANGFTDIAGNTHEQSIIKMAARGITQGFPDGTFRPNDPVTRGQMMTFLDRFNSGITCTECHNGTDQISGIHNSWVQSVHGSGTANAYAGGRASCSGCHSGGGFSARIAAGEMNPDNFTTTYANPSRIDCRSCHQIHTTYTDTDWALETTAAVPLYATAGATFDGGKGNLCANCHQARRGFPAPNAEGKITGISTHWGPHHGPQASMMLGVAGAGATGTPSVHYQIVQNTCVGCHMGNADDPNHTFTPNVATCKTCHADATNFDVDGVQTEVEARLDAIGDALVAAGALDQNTVDGHATQDAITNGLPVATATALYNWLYIAHEDKSLGVHNPAYTDALLTAAEDALGL